MRNTLMRILPVLLSLHLLTPQEVVSGCSTEEQQTVYIVNTLPIESEPLNAQCKFDGKDVANGFLYHDQDFHWSYCDDANGKILSCHLRWGPKQTTFDAFKVSKKSRISETFWSARSDGIHLRDTVGNDRKVDWTN